MSEILVSLSKPVRPTEKIAWEPELLISENIMSKLGDSFHTGSLVKILAASHADADAKEALENKGDVISRTSMLGQFKGMLVRLTTETGSRRTFIAEHERDSFDNIGKCDALLRWSGFAEGYFSEETSNNIQGYADNMTILRLHVCVLSPSTVSEISTSVARKRIFARKLCNIEDFLSPFQKEKKIKCIDASTKYSPGTYSQTSSLISDHEAHQYYEREPSVPLPCLWTSVKAVVHCSKFQSSVWQHTNTDLLDYLQHHERRQKNDDLALELSQMQQYRLPLQRRIPFYHQQSNDAFKAKTVNSEACSFEYLNNRYPPPSWISSCLQQSGTGQGIALAKSGTTIELGRGVFVSIWCETGSSKCSSPKRHDCCDYDKCKPSTISWGIVAGDADIAVYSEPTWRSQIYDLNHYLAGCKRPKIFEVRGEERRTNFNTKVINTFRAGTEMYVNAKNDELSVQTDQEISDCAIVKRSSLFPLSSLDSSLTPSSDYILELRLWRCLRQKNKYFSSKVSYNNRAPTQLTALCGCHCSVENNGGISPPLLLVKCKTSGGEEALATVLRNLINRTQRRLSLSRKEKAPRHNIADCKYSFYEDETIFVYNFDTLLELSCDTFARKRRRLETLGLSQEVNSPPKQISCAISRTNKNVVDTARETPSVKYNRLGFRLREALDAIISIATEQERPVVFCIRDADTIFPSSSKKSTPSNVEPSDTRGGDLDCLQILDRFLTRLAEAKKKTMTNSMSKPKAFGTGRQGKSLHLRLAIVALMAGNHGVDKMASPLMAKFSNFSLRVLRPVYLSVQSTSTLLVKPTGSILNEENKSIIVEGRSPNIQENIKFCHRFNQIFGSKGTAVLEKLYLVFYRFAKMKFRISLKFIRRYHRAKYGGPYTSVDVDPRNRNEVVFNAHGKDEKWGALNQRRKTYKNIDRYNCPYGRQISKEQKEYAHRIYDQKNRCGTLANFSAKILMIAENSLFSSVEEMQSRNEKFVHQNFSPVTRIKSEGFNDGLGANRRSIFLKNGEIVYRLQDCSRKEFTGFCCGKSPAIAKMFMLQNLDTYPLSYSPTSTTFGFTNIYGLEEAKRSMVEALLLPYQNRRLIGHFLLNKKTQNVQGDDHHLNTSSATATLANFNTEIGAYDFATIGATSILLYGPPGTGKTSIARAAAEEMGAKLLELSAAEIVNAAVGVSETALENAFQEARTINTNNLHISGMKNKNNAGFHRKFGDHMKDVMGMGTAPSACFIFIDEFQSLFAKRGSKSGDGGSLATLLLRLMDESSNTATAGHNVIGYTLSKEIRKEQKKPGIVSVIAATNVPHAIDSAFLRPGRFDYAIYCPPPQAFFRRSIFATHSAAIESARSRFLSAKEVSSNWQLKFLYSVNEYTSSQWQALIELYDMKSMFLSSSSNSSSITSRFFDCIIARTINFTVADLSHLSRSAFYRAIERREHRPGCMFAVMPTDFNKALSSMRPSVTSEMKQHYEQWRSALN